MLKAIVFPTYNKNLWSIKCPWNSLFVPDRLRPLLVILTLMLLLEQYHSKLIVDRPLRNFPFFLDVAILPFDFETRPDNLGYNELTLNLLDSPELGLLVKISYWPVLLGSRHQGNVIFRKLFQAHEVEML